MKEEDRRIYYRPDVAKDLQQAMDYALKLYEANIERVYYVILSDIELDTEISQFLLETAKCFDGSFSGIEKFYRDYEYDLKHKYHIPLFNYEYFFPIQGFGVLSLIFIWLYNGSKTRKNKWIQYAFYSFYPLHMMFIYLVYRFMF